MLQQVLMTSTEDTAYAPSYSERAFREIEVGDTEADVRTALGSPLSERAEEPSVSWLYAPLRSEEFEADGSYPDVRFSFTVLHFDENGVFRDAFGQISHMSDGGVFSSSGSGAIGNGVNTLGLSDEAIADFLSTGATTVELEAELGTPGAVFRSRAVKWMYSSHSPGSKNYRQRFIAIDRDGKVCRVRSEFYWD